MVKKTHDGILTEPYKVEKVYGGKCEYRIIQAFQACNYNGENVGYLTGTSAGDRWLTEKRFIPNSRFESVKFTNYWR